MRVKHENARRARKRLTGGTYTVFEWQALKNQYHNRCLACGKSEQQLKRLGRKLVPDHVIPLAHQGRNTLDNIQPLCHGMGGCNNRKNVKHLDYR
jgi:predicted restriction endonuclease